MMSSFAARTAQQTRHLLFEAVIKGTLLRRRLGFAPCFARCRFKGTRLGHWCGLRNRPWLGLGAHLGFGAAWLTEWYAYDRNVLDAFGLAPHEQIAGFVHIGRPTHTPEDRPRPALTDIVTRFS